MPTQTPACAGSFQNIQIIVPEHSVVNARFPAAVAAGNVETSTRIVDVVLGALASALPNKIPAASHGSMNNLAMGYVGGDSKYPAWDYYETIGGGMGASAISDGLDAVQTHMTNTLNTPIEALEMKYPLRVLRYQIRQGSAGAGRFNGGNGLVREYEFLNTAVFTLLTERRSNKPWGLSYGGEATAGVNFLNGEPLAAKVSMQVKRGDVLVIETPGGGGFGGVDQ
jgi:N-methylhydantoinase B